ncbi:MAG TPA: TetR family transcriptional regulator [Baekduia sp.]|nr:TetR family transcriptional regulator [Baekduia sp.]
MASDAREKMIESTTALVRERGVEATALSDVLEHSGAPRGSIYHHFPGGKAQLVEEATRAAGGAFAEGMVAALDAGDPLAALHAFADLWLATLRESDYGAGCPIVAVAVEGDRMPAARAAAGDAFAAWQRALAEALARRGIAKARAASLAALAVASIEGGVILARAQRSPEPLERVRDELLAVAASALPRG